MNSRISTSLLRVYYAHKPSRDTWIHWSK